MASDSSVSPMDRVFWLLCVPEFEGLAPSELGRIAARTSLVEHRAGATLYAPGQALPELGIVLRGRVEVRADDGVRCVAPRQCISAVAPVLAGVEAPLCVASVDTVILRLGLADLEDLLEEEFGLFTAVLRGLSRALLGRNPLPDASGMHVPSRERRRALDDAPDLIRTILLLRDVVGFGVTRLDVLSELAEQAVPIERRAGAPLIHEITGNGRFVVVAAGSVRCATPEESVTLHAPVALGLLEALAGLSPRFSATAASDLFGFQVAGAALIDLIEDHPSLGLDVLRAVAVRVAR